MLNYQRVLCMPYGIGMMNATKNAWPRWRGLSRKSDECFNTSTVAGVPRFFKPLPDLTEFAFFATLDKTLDMMPM